MRKAGFWMLAMAVCLCAFAARADWDTPISLGAELDAEYIIGAIRSVVSDYCDARYQWGGLFFQWPHKTRATLTRRLLDAVPPVACFISGVPGKNDIADAEAERLARSAVAKKYGLGKKDVAEDAYGAYAGFDAADPKNPAWVVDLLPLGTVWPNVPVCYTVRLSGKGKTLSVRQYADDNERGTQDPFVAVVLVLQDEVYGNGIPDGSWTLEEQLKLNFIPLFRMFGGGEIHGLPDENAMPRDAALDRALACAGGLGEYTPETLKAMRVDTAYYIGDSEYAGKMRAAASYPCWRFDFVDAATGDVLFVMLIGAENGALVEYRRAPYGVSPPSDAFSF